MVIIVIIITTDKNCTQDRVLTCINFVTEEYKRGWLYKGNNASKIMGGMIRIKYNFTIRQFKHMKWEKNCLYS